MQENIENRKSELEKGKAEYSSNKRLIAVVAILLIAVLVIIYKVTTIK